MSRVELTVSGMTCEHCVATLAAALRSVPGAIRVEAALGRATVEYADDVCTVTALSEAVRSAGFSVARFLRASDAASSP